MSIYRLHRRKIIIFTTITAVLSLLLLVMSYLFLHMGYGSSTIIYQYRLNRITAAILVGLILGLTGALLQSSLRNPLVDHYILGIGSGGVFAVMLFYLFRSNAYSLALLTIIAAAGGLVALTITIIVAESVGGGDIAYVLAGIGVNSMFSGASLLLSYIVASKNPYIAYALVGSFIAIDPDWIPLLEALSAISFVLYILSSKPLNTLLMGDEYAAQQGYNPRTTRLLIVLFSGVIGASVVACCGLIGFIGLVSPHIARLMLGTSDNRLVPVIAGLTGAILLLLSDNFSRLVLAGPFLVSVGEVPAGAIVSLFGAPFFISIMIRRLRGHGA